MCYLLILMMVICGWQNEPERTLLTVGFEKTLPGAVNYRTITAALEEVNSTEGKYEIWVKQGRYTEQELLIFRTVEMYGGFTGRETTRKERGSKPELTILDGGLEHRVATVSGLIDGFQIQNGHEKGCGGGVRLLDGTVQNCMILNNEAGEWGGGIYCEGYGNVVQNSGVMYNVCKQDTAVICGWWKGKGNSLKKL